MVRRRYKLKPGPLHCKSEIERRDSVKRFWSIREMVWNREIESYSRRLGR